ncbi:AAA family ATPase, partial [Thiotrichales bacterium 19S11-10]|nr:AAA family ATPase [Thiotrichales bacterium 19S11-10]
EVYEGSNVNQSLAKHYINMDKNDRLVVSVVNHTNKDQRETTGIIRERLKENGELSLEEISYQSLSNKSLSDTEKKYLKLYHVGDRVTFNAFSKGQKSFIIESIDKDKGILSFKSQNMLNTYGRSRNSMQLSFKELLEKNFHINKAQHLKLSVNDQVRLLDSLYINHKKTKFSQPETLKIEKGVTFSINSISSRGISISYENKNIWLSSDQLKETKLDYAYVIKPYQLDKDTKKILTSLSGYQVNKNTIGDLSEYAQKVILFTDNKEKAVQSLEKSETSWLAADLSTDDHKNSYKPIVRGLDSISKDIKIVADALSDSLPGSKRESRVQSATSFSIVKLSEKEASFSMNDLLKESMKYALGSVSHEDIERIIQEKKDNGELLISDNKITTKEIYELEKSIINNVQEGRNKVLPIFTQSPDMPKYLTQGQKDAVSLSLTTKDQFIGIQGLAGTGKTTMMKELKKQAETKGFKLVGIAPTHKAVQMLDGSMNEKLSGSRLNQSGIEVMTAHAFINAKLSQYDDKTIFIIDESSMIGNRLYSQIQEKTKAINARAIFSGDIKQQPAIDHGKPQELCLLNGMKYAQMNEIVRQNANPILKKSAELAAAGQAGESIKSLERINPFDHVKRQAYYSGSTQSFVEVGCDKNEKGIPVLDKNNQRTYHRLYQSIANDYLTRIPEQRNQTIIVASRHKDRQAIDQLIRNGLKKESLITNSIPTVRLASKNLDQVELFNAKSYQINDRLKFDCTFSIAKKGDVMKVIAIDAEKNKLKILNQNDGNVYSINPAKLALGSKMSAYKPLNVELGIGDKIRLRASDKQRGWLGGSEYKVSEIKDGKAYLSNEKSQLTLNLDDQKDQIWDYAYTNTTYSVQGDTSKYFIGLELSENDRSHYIQITRASHHAIIYTDNKDKLISRLDNERVLYEASKRSALELFESKLAKKTKSQTNKISNEKNASNYANETKKTTLADINEIKSQLNNRMEELAIHLLGKPNQKMSNNHQLRFGKNGSLVINLEKAQWYCHERGIGGNSLDLIKNEQGISQFKDILSYAKSFLNYDELKPIDNKNNTRDEIKTIKNNSDKNDKIKAYAQSLYEKSLPLKGTLGEKYLSEIRGLTNYKNSDIRYLKSISAYDNKTNKKIYVPAIIAFSKDNDNKLNHVQVIRLNQAGNKNRDVSITKQTYGSMNGFAVELNNKAKSNEVTYLSEGIETGLSILNVEKNAHILAVLGKSNFANIDLNKLSDKVILALDNDGKCSISEDKTIQKAISRLEESGKDVKIIMPEKAKYDFNDVLKKEGYQALSKQLNNVIDKPVLHLDHKKDEIDKIIQRDQVENIAPNEQKAETRTIGKMDKEILL